MAAACRGPLPPGWPHSRLHLEPGDSCRFQPGSGWAKVVRAGVMGAHPRRPQRSGFPTAGCPQVPQCPQSTCANTCLLGRKAGGTGPGCKRGRAPRALRSGRLTGPRLHPRGSGQAMSPCPACPPPPPGQPEEFIGDWAHDLVTEMTVCYRAARVAALCCWGPTGVRSELGVGTRGDPALGVWGRPHLQHDESWGGGTRGAAGPRGPGQGP